MSFYFVRYFERSRGYKFNDLATKSIFESGNEQFFEDVEFTREIRLRTLTLRINMLIFPHVLLNLVKIRFLFIFET